MTDFIEGMITKVVVKSIAKKARDKFALSDTSSLQELKTKFVTVMHDSLSQGIEQIELILPYQWDKSIALKKHFFEFLSDIGAVYTEHYQSCDSNDPREHSYHYLKINCQGV